jgi:hypothetical protein
VGCQKSRMSLKQDVWCRVGQTTVPSPCRLSSENSRGPSFVYLALKRTIELGLLCLQSSDTKEVEILERVTCVT